MRIVFSVLGIIACLFLALASAQFGLAKLLGRYGVASNSLPATSEAIRLMPRDADAHRAQARVFTTFRMYSEARRELEIATSLRPKDDYLWLDLGMVRDELNDSEGALKAFDQAVVNAPFYAHTRWQRANLRLRLGRYDEAFVELQEAARSNRRFLPNLIDLGWSLSRGDAKVTEQLAGIESPESRVEFARFLARKGKGKEVLEQFKLASQYMPAEYRKELVRELIANNAYEDAFEIWKSTEAAPVNSSQIYDGGFEAPISFGETGFGWRISQAADLEVSQDVSEKEGGAKSLRIVFKGDTPSTQALASELVILQAGKQYRVSFAAKSRDIVTGGPPQLVISNAYDRAVLTSFDLANSDLWQSYSIDFATPRTCSAIELKLARKKCASLPCPIFGTLWLDSFSIAEIAQ